MRALVPLLILLTLAAACGGGSNPRSTTTPSSTATATVPTATPAPTTQAVIPFTPVEEVLTPPPDIDTSGWLTYQDAAHSFELKYPPDAQVKQNVTISGPGPIGLGAEIDLPVAPGTVLYEKFAFIQVTDSPEQQCVPWQLTHVKPDSPPAVRLVRNTKGTAFWLTEEPGGGMSHWVHDWVYMTSMRRTCVTVNGSLYGVDAAVVDPTPLPIDYARETEVFTAILSTFRWTSP